MINNSIIIILDNIKVLCNSKKLTTYKDISDYTGISISTIATWYSPKRKQQVLPRLKTLDKMCDKFKVHTSDLFIKESEFKHKYSGPNNTMNNFKVNFERICIEKSHTKIKDRIDLLFGGANGHERYYSYMRKKNPRSIPIDALDEIANKLNIETVELVK